jgi:hypothetical protein
MLLVGGFITIFVHLVNYKYICAIGPHTKDITETSFQRTKHVQCTRSSEALKCQLKMRETKGFYILEHLWTGTFLFINLAAPFLSFLSALRMDPRALVLLFIGENIKYNTWLLQVFNI